MKFFEDKSIFQKIAISILLILVFSFAVPKNVEAKGDGLGGKLLHPVVSLVIAIGDGVLDVFHKAILNQDTTLLAIDTTSSIWNKIGAFLLAAVVVVAVGVLIYATAGGALAALVAAVPVVGASASGVAGIIGGVLAITIATLTGGMKIVGAAAYNLAYMDDTICLPFYSISPEEIFSGELAIFDADFFNPSKETTTNDDGEVKHVSIAYRLRSTISTWYFTLRNIAIVASLSILVYVGIRIMISSTAADKSKYKQMLNDWIISLCLIFAMHYIMSFSNLLVKRVSGLLNSIDKTSYINYIFMDEEKSKTILKALEEEDNKQLLYKYGIVPEGAENEKIEEALITENDGEKVLVWPTNMMGMVRLQAQVANKENSVTFAGYTVIFLVMVIFTIAFSFTYFRRILYMAFLTLLAPLVGMTYALDKLKDGSAQGFNNWFKEYMVNLIIQPVHLLLYTVLVTSALELATENIIYSIVAIGFLIPAEKLVRKFFGINATDTQGLLAGPAGAAIVMTGLNRLLGHRPGGSEVGKGGKGTDDENKELDTAIREDFNEDDTLFGEPSTGINTNTGFDSGVNSDFGNQPQNDDDQSINIPSTTGNTGNNTTVPGVSTPGANVPGNNTNVSTGGNITGIGAGTGQSGVSNGSSASGSRRDTPKENNIGRGLGSALRYFGKAQAKKMKARAKTAHPVRRTIGAFTGAAAAGIGAAAGVASGDINKVLQNAAGAGIAGYKFGEAGIAGVGNNLSSVTDDIQGTYDAFQKGRLGEAGYKNTQIEDEIKKRKKELRKDDEFKKQLSKKLDSEQQAKEAINDDDLMKNAIQYGLTDVADIAALYKRTHEDSVIDGKTVARAPSVDNVAAEIMYLKKSGISKDTTKMGHKDREDFRNSVKDRISRRRGSEATDEEVNNYINRFDATSRILFGK